MRILLPALLVSLLSALSTSQIESWYETNELKRVCSAEVEKFFTKTNNEAVMSLYGMACLKLHKINNLAIPALKLRSSPQARENAAYFADLLLKKKLLYHALIDGIDISYVRLAKSDYILSMIFDRFVKGEYELVGGEYIFSESGSDTFYALEVLEDALVLKIILKTYKNNELVSRIEYW